MTVGAFFEVLIPVLGAVQLVVMVGLAGYYVWRGLARGEIPLKHGRMSRAENPKAFRQLLKFCALVFALLLGVLIYVACLNAGPLFSRSTSIN